MENALTTITTTIKPDLNCKICKGEGWVCENHPEVPWDWGDGCCGAAGMLCSCNPEGKHINEAIVLEIK